MTSSNQAFCTTKPPKAPKLRKDPMGASDNTVAPKLPIHHGSIFRWRPSQSLGFQIAAVTANSAAGKTKPWSASSSAYSSSYITDQSTVSTHSAFSSSEDSTSTPQGYHSTFFVISKIDPWGPTAIFAPQLKVGMRIVAINRQPCPKTPEGLHALLDSEHTEEKFSPNMVHPALYDNQEESTPDSSATGWITFHAVDLEEELRQRQYYLNRVEQRGLEPDEQRSEQRSEQSSEASPLLDDIREDGSEEGINVIRVEIVTKGQELNPEDQDFRQKLKALHFLEEKRQIALFHEAKAKKKEKSDRRRDKQLGYMAGNIWDMKIRTEEGDVAALDDFSLLPAAASRKPEPKQTKTQLQKDIETIEKWQDAKALKEIQKKVQSIEEKKKKKKKSKKGKKEKKETKGSSEKISDWNFFEALQTMLVASPPPRPPQASPPPSQAKSKSIMPLPSIFDESVGSTMASTISTKSGNEYQAWFAGWGEMDSDEESAKSASSIIENAPKKLLLKASISPQQWFCGTSTSSVKKTEKKAQQKLKMPREVKCIKKDPAGSMKRDPEGTRAAVDVGCESNQPKQTQLDELGKRDMGPKPSAPERVGAVVDVGCSSIQPKLTQLRKLGKQETRPKRSALEGTRATDGVQAFIGCPRTNQPKQTQLQKVGKRDMGPAWSAQLGSYSDSMSTKPTCATKSSRRTTVEELRQLVARIEMSEQTQNHKQLHKPMGKAIHFRNPALPPVRSVQQQPVISAVDRSVPSYVQTAPSSSGSMVSKLGDGRELQGTIQSNSKMTLLIKAQKPKGKKNEAGVVVNTTTAFTLPASRSNSSEEKKKQLKKLQATWKAARARKAKEAKRAAAAEARQANGTPEWEISSLFQSFFQCG
ncbi:MAG: hypothetical protein SGBAC_009069 [Bacillariaceae sp.]